LRCNINHINAMARPIKETPVVTGKDAKRFAEKMAHGITQEMIVSIKK
jgi:hypothetical protein